MSAIFPNTPAYDLVAEAERKKQNWFQQKFGRAFSIKSTTQYAGMTRATADESGNVVVKKSYGTEIISLVVFLLFIAIMLFNFISISNSTSLSGINPPSIFFVAVMAAPIIFLVNFLYARKDKSRPKIITINKQGIFINDESIPWAEIRQTFIVEKPKGKSVSKRLVIVTSTDTLLYYNLDGFSLWGNSLLTVCAAIRDFQPNK
ncbi:hypothetical protein CLV51_1011678 [Chitinophaga niastensis]|uniref:Uncharacterized protein n=1 Tax=Chitinophaga niastensis TaxID=536980 RepID=A0A2P8HVR8_CHINA|nr:hypothetical protein [Chitinophaga niastensis]PSL50333.1 hypothetical protein CLV51_1011678 [Chitinophaga niastensis]